MPCDRRLKKGQSIQQRAEEIRQAVAKITSGLVGGKVRVVIGPQGAVAFSGITESERDGVTDGCLYRRIMSGNSSLAKAAIARAEQLAGRTIDRRAVAQGIHSHNGGVTFHNHKG